jgi:hypothetical protein
MSARHTFKAETLAALFQAVETDDVVDPVVSLPSPVPVACSAEDMQACFDLCLQFWYEQVDRRAMCDLVATLLVAGDLPQDARVRYKHIRAAYKQQRFALVLYGRHHKAPLLFRATVALMGHLQDAFRNRRRLAVPLYALLLRMLLTWPAWLAVRREVENVRLDDAEGFLAFRKDEFRRLASWLEGGALTGHRFHMMRKVVSRQVSFYDAMRTLRPDEQVYRMSRFLSAINGLMGSMHDDLVEQAGNGHRDYNRDRFPMPEDIRGRLQALTESYPLAPAA